MMKGGKENVVLCTVKERTENIELFVRIRMIKMC